MPKKTAKKNHLKNVVGGRGFEKALRDNVFGWPVSGLAEQLERPSQK